MADNEKVIDQEEKEIENPVEKEPEKEPEINPGIKSGDNDEEEQEEEQDDTPTGKYEIINRHTYQIANGENIFLCDIVSDSKDDLPDADAITLEKIGFGSFAYCINEREFYVLNSGGEWL